MQKDPESVRKFRSQLTANMEPASPAGGQIPMAGGQEPRQGAPQALGGPLSTVAWWSPRGNARGGQALLLARELSVSMQESSGTSICSGATSPGVVDSRAGSGRATLQQSLTVLSKDISAASEEECLMAEEVTNDARLTKLRGLRIKVRGAVVGC